MNTLAIRLLTTAALATVASAQNPDFLATFSQPERTLSGSGGTVLQGLFPNEIVQVSWSTSTCTTFSAEKWSPRTAFHTMAGDENGDGTYWNPTIFGAIDALLTGPAVTTAAGPANQRTVFFSPSVPMGINVSAAPLRPGDVGRIIRNGAGDGQVQHFIRQEQINLALGLPLATPIDVDAIAFQQNYGVFFSLDADIFTPLCGGTLVRDGDILCIPGGALAYTPDLRIAGTAGLSAVVVYTEAQVDAMVVNAGIANRLGVCINSAIDTEALEIDLFGPVVGAPTCTGIAIPVPTLIFSTETMTGASLLTTIGGGNILPRPCGPVGSPCGTGPTFGPQIGLRPPAAAFGVQSYVNAIATARVCHHVLEAQQPVLNVFPLGAPAGATQIDYGSQFGFNMALIEIVPPVVPASFPAFPFSQLCFPDLYAPSVFVHAFPLFGTWGSFPMVAIPPGFAGKVLFQSVGFGPGTFELSTPVVIDVQ
ncbi:MAG: hypothetical protein MUC36_17925 [Planctomycetes bacterium]|jgi:hypothetical protein|nr:hypothetical protein [Planctomycetota bacterium]